MFLLWPCWMILKLHLFSYPIFCLLSTATLEKNIYNFSGKIELNEAVEINLPFGIERAGSQRLGFSLVFFTNWFFNTWCSQCLSILISLMGILLSQDHEDVKMRSIKGYESVWNGRKATWYCFSNFMLHIRILGLA